MIAVATVFNFAVLRWKMSKGRFADAITDVFFLVVLNFLFAGTYTGMAIAMIAGALISLYLLVHPPVISMSKKFVIWCIITLFVFMAISLSAYIMF